MSLSFCRRPIPVTQENTVCMATYALIHGASDVGWYWHLVERELRARGHRTVAPDLAIEREDATLLDHARAVIAAVEGTRDDGELIVVGQSWGGYVAPIVAELANADRLVLVAPVIPRPGETSDEMWEATGWEFPQDEPDAFYHDVDPALAAAAQSRERPHSASTDREPWPMDAWPQVPTHVIIGTDDRFLRRDWLRGVVRDRLGIEPDELPTGHTPALSRPRELAELLESYRTK